MVENYIVIRENILNIANSNKEFLSLTKFIKGAKGKKVKNIDEGLNWLISLKIVDIKSEYFFIMSKNSNKKFIILDEKKLIKYNNKEYYIEKCNIKEALDKLDDSSNKEEKIQEKDSKEQIYYAVIDKIQNTGTIYFNPPIMNNDSVIKIFKDILKANEWIMKNLQISILNTVEKDVIYFDSGTGRGYTEVKVTNHLSQSLLDKFNKRNYMITENDTICLGNIDNNYGELYGFYLSLKIALENNIKKIAGDSQTILYE